MYTMYTMYRKRKQYRSEQKCDDIEGRFFLEVTMSRYCLRGKWISPKPTTKIHYDSTSESEDDKPTAKLQKIANETTTTKEDKPKVEEVTTRTPESKPRVRKILNL